MNRSFMKLALAFIGVAALAGSASATVATLSGDPDPEPFLREVEALDSQSYPVVRASGGDPDQAKPIGTTSRGLGVSAVRSADGRCVLFSDRNQFCASDEQVRSGTSYSVANDCARPAGDMRITVVMPRNSARAVVTRSDGRSVAMTLADDIAWLEAQVPTRSQPAFARAVSFDAAGGVLSEVELPKELCPGA